MAHFAELDATNTVLQVVVVHNDITTTDGVEDEQRGIDFLNDLFPDSVTWVQTSYNSRIRGGYASIGGDYDAVADAFRPRQPFLSWVWAVDQWEAPVACPVTNPTESDPVYHWDEDTTSWIEVEAS